MSIILKINIGGSYINVPQTKTKETSFILGFDVDSMRTDDFVTYPVFISSKENKEEFDKVFGRFRQMTVKSIVETQNIDNNAFLTAYLEIKDALKTINSFEDKNTGVEVKFSFS